MVDSAPSQSATQQVLSQHVLNKVDVCGPGQVPHQLDTGVPGPIYLASHLSKQVPEHRTIEMGRIHIYC